METTLDFQNQTIQEIYSKLGKLERQNWWLKIFGALLIFISIIPLAIIYFFLGLPQDKPFSKIIRAEKFIVVDKQGKQKAILGDILNELKVFFKPGDKYELSNIIEGLLIFGKDDKPRIFLAFGDDTSSNKNQERHFLVFLDQKLKKRIEISNENNIEKVESLIRILDENENSRAGLSYDRSTWGNKEASKESKIYVSGDSSYCFLGTRNIVSLFPENLEKTEKTLYREEPMLSLNARKWLEPGPQLTLKIEDGKYPLLTMHKHTGFLIDEKNGIKNITKDIDEEKMIVGFNNSDMPSIKLFDKKQNIRTILGSTELINKSGTEIKTPLSSIVLFNEKGNVIWRVPTE